MVTITENTITVEAETLRKAQAQLRKAKKAEAKKQEERDRLCDIAYQRAYAVIGRICSTA